MNALLHFFRYDLLLAWRNMVARPTLGLTVIATLASTLATVAVVVNLNILILAKPLPYPDTDKLWVTQQSETIAGDVQYGYQILPAQYHIYQDTTFIESMVIIQQIRQRLKDFPTPISIYGPKVTPEYFDLFNVPMLLGRGFSSDESITDERRVVVLSYALWRDHFNQDRDIVDTYTQIGNDAYQIVGVVHPDFQQPQLLAMRDADMWMSFHEAAGEINWDSITSTLTGVAKLKPGVNIEQMNAVLGAQINELYQNVEGVAANTSIGAKFIPIENELIGHSQPLAISLLIGVVLLLIVAVTNITNLFLSRAAQQQRVMAIQAAMGAHSKHIFRGMFAESLLLTGIACIVGLIIAGWAMVWLKEDLNNLFTRIQQLQLDPLTITSSLVVSLVIAFIVAALAAKRVNYQYLNSQLQSSGKGTSGQISSVTRNILIMTQVCLTSVILIAASSVLMPVVSKLNQPMGMTVKDRYYVRVDRGTINTELPQLAEQLKQLFSNDPRIENTAVTGFNPLQMGAEHYLHTKQQELIGIFSWSRFSREMFDILEMPIINGRSFDDDHPLDQLPNEIILSQSLAKRLYGNDNPIGETLYIEVDEPRTVIGVVADIKVPRRGNSYALERYYVPSNGASSMTFVFNSEQTFTREDVRSLIHTIDPRLSVSYFNTLDGVASTILERDRLMAQLLSSLMLLALLLAAAGIYGVLSFNVQLRQRELGIHLSLGAQTHSVIAMVVKQSIKPIIAGLLLGVLLPVCGYFAGLKITSFNMTTDFVAGLIAIPVMLIAALGACYLPVQQVVKRNPLQALQED